MAWLADVHDLAYDLAALCAAICLGLGTPNGRTSERDLSHLEALLRKRPVDYQDHSPMEATALTSMAFQAFASVRKTHPFLQRLLDIPTFATANATCIFPEDEDCTMYGGDVEYGFMSLGDNIFYHQFWHKPGMARFSVLAPFIGLNKWGVVASFLSKGHRPDRISLLVAIKYSSLDQVCRLSELMAPADLSGIPPCSWDTPLQSVCRMQRKDVVEYLLHRGLDVNAAPATRKLEKCGQIADFFSPRTALQAAIEKADVDVIELLLEASVDVNAPAPDDYGSTALQIAASKGQIGIARRLVGFGADVNAGGARYRGRTALEAAAEHGRLDMVSFLLDQGLEVVELAEARVDTSDLDH